jgi:L-serine dehydratase
MTRTSGTLASYRTTARELGAPLSRVFLDEEARNSGKRPEVLEAMMLERMNVMRQALARGLAKPQHSRSGLIRGGAHRMDQWIQGGGSLLAPAFSRLVAAALSVAEVNACMGRIVASPTAGACGVLPAALFTVAEEKGCDDAALVRAFFTAGGIGLVIEKLASLSGAEGGCQAEVGSASAMAAGALVELMGGTPDQVDHAVAFALANVMGLICDPVKGLVEVPCVKRNAMGAVNAAACAEMALAGLESVFPADAVIETMGKVGRRIPEEYRETARGGLAALPLPECDACRTGDCIS